MGNHPDRGRNNPHPHSAFPMHDHVFTEDNRQVNRYLSRAEEDRIHSELEAEIRVSVNPSPSEQQANRRARKNKILSSYSRSSVFNLKTRSPAILIATLVIVTILSFVIPSILFYGIENDDLDDNQCSLDDSRRFSHPRKPQALVILPQPNTLWTRSMIEKVTGYTTTSAKCQRKYIDLGLKEECGDPRFSICTSTLSPVVNVTLPGERYPETHKCYSSVLLFVRNPFDTIYSNFLETEAGIKAVSGEQAEGNHFNIPDSFVKEQVRLYKLYYHYWTDAPIHHAHIRHEDIERNPLQTWAHIGYFLGISVSDERITCALELENAETKLSKHDLKSFTGINYFSSESIKYIHKELWEELCALDYNLEPEINIDCDEKWEEMRLLKKLQLVEEEKQRHKEAERLAAARLKRKKDKEKTKGKSKLKFWWEGLKVLPKKKVKKEVSNFN